MRVSDLPAASAIGGSIEVIENEALLRILHPDADIVLVNANTIEIGFLLGRPGGRFLLTNQKGTVALRNLGGK